MKEITTEDFINVLSADNTNLSIEFKDREFDLSDLDYINHIIVNKRVEFKGCIFSSEVSFWGFEFKQSLIFKECKFSKGLWLHDVTVSSRFEISESECNDIYLNHSKFNSGYIENSTINSLMIHGGSSTEAFLVGSIQSEKKYPIGRIVVMMENGSIVSTKFRNCLCTERFSMTGVLQTGEIQIDNLTCLNFELVDFYNSSKFAVYDLKSQYPLNTTFQLERCSLGDALLFKIDFKSFACVNIVDSYLADAKFIRTRWKLSIDAKSKTRAEDPKYLLEGRMETFRQLKLSASKTGNHIEEKSFYSEEMNAYNNSVPWNRKYIWTKLILGFSNHCSKYGQSFGRPLLGLFLTTLIIFVILIWFFEYKGRTINLSSKFNANELNRAIGEFFYILNPARKFETLIGWAMFWDLLSRVLASAFIYNMIRATRRFVG